MFHGCPQCKRNATIQTQGFDFDEEIEVECKCGCIYIVEFSVELIRIIKNNPETSRIKEELLAEVFARDYEDRYTGRLFDLETT